MKHTGRTRLLYSVAIAVALREIAEGEALPEQIKQESRAEGLSVTMTTEDNRVIVVDHGSTMNVDPLIVFDADPSFVHRIIAEQTWMSRLSSMMSPTDRRFSIDSIVHHVSDTTGVSVAQLKGPRRLARYVFARHLAIWIAKRKTRLTLKEIANFFGGRDHTTAVHAIRQIDDALTYNSNKARIIRQTLFDLEAEEGAS